MLVYKLTDEQGMTHGDTQWGEGVSHEASGVGGLYGPGWIHCNDDPLIALLMNPIYTEFRSPRLWKALAEGPTLDNSGLKRGVRKLTTLREITLPEITLEQRVTFGILCAKEVYTESEWNTWADEWLDNTNRSSEAAKTAAYAAAEAVKEAASEIYTPAAITARAAETAAYAAVHAAADTDTEDYFYEAAAFAVDAAYYAHIVTGVEFYARLIDIIEQAMQRSSNR